jgi:hypothetical protein
MAKELRCRDTGKIRNKNYNPLKKIEMELQGTIYSIGPVQEVSEKFRKQEIILETLNGEYTQHIKLQFAQKKIDLLQSFAPGSEVVCQINIAGKLYKNKEGKEDSFTNIVCWKIDNVGTNVITNPTEDTSLPF